MYSGVWTSPHTHRQERILLVLRLHYNEKNHEKIKNNGIMHPDSDVKFVS